MALAPGTILGQYEIRSPLGAGGMGEVYRAQDTRLDREVAIKVLPESLTADPDRLRRFEQEARAVAALNHPNILAVYQMATHDGVSYMVTELLDGETLRERLRRCPVPIRKAIDYAVQIAHGLAAAHDKGITHRDLKPVNLFVTKDGRAKILDFGLAKVGPSKDSSGEEATLGTGTEPGMVMGTAGYMSPEQVRGKTADHRSDIFAFGTILYEMVTGKQTFRKPTSAETMTAILNEDPPSITQVTAATPPGLQRVVNRCLEKSPEQRFQSASDMAFALEALSDSGMTTSTGGHPAVAEPTSRRGIAIAGAALVLLLVVGALAYLWMRPAPASREVLHLDIIYPPNVEPVSGLQGGPSISPDGQNVAMIGVREGVRRLYIRRLDRPEATEISNTAGASAASFSPDSKSVVFTQGSGLITRLSLADHQRAVLAQSADIEARVAWVSTDIVYSRGGALWIVPAQGGAPRQLTVLDTARREVSHTDPLGLPGGRVVLFSSLTTDAGTERIEAVSLDRQKRTVVIEHARVPVWSPTGHLLFGRDGAVWAVPFDENSATTRGATVPVIPAGIVCTAGSGRLPFQLSSTRALVFVPADFDSKRVVSVGRDASELALNLPADRYGTPRISPNGRTLLVESQGSYIETVSYTHLR